MQYTDGIYLKSKKETTTAILKTHCINSFFVIIGKHASIFLMSLMMSHKYLDCGPHDVWLSRMYCLKVNTQSEDISVTVV